MINDWFRQEHRRDGDVTSYVQKLPKLKDDINETLTSIWKCFLKASFSNCMAVLIHPFWLATAAHCTAKWVRFHHTIKMKCRILLFDLTSTVCSYYSSKVYLSNSATNFWRTKQNLTWTLRWARPTLETPTTRPSTGILWRLSTTQSLRAEP